MQVGARGARESLSSTKLLKYPGKVRRDSKMEHDFFFYYLNLEGIHHLCTHISLARNSHAILHNFKGEMKRIKWNVQ